MSVDRSTVAFFDASCLIAAASSPSGGSGFLLSLCARGFLRAAVSQPVLLEAETNLLAKFPPSALATHRRQLAATPMIITPVPSAAARRRYAGLINPKDDHVVAAAIAVRAPFLLTLDQSLENEVNRASLPLRAYAPGGFITGELPSHPDFSHLRQ
jgi:predicted nucleic acid-binding protein